MDKLLKLFEEKNGKVSRRRETIHAMRAIFRYFVLSIRFGIAAAVVDEKGGRDENRCGSLRVPGRLSNMVVHHSDAHTVNNTNK